MGNRCCHFFSAVFDRIPFELAGNDDIHKSMDEFEILLDLTTDYRVSCLERPKIDVATFSWLLFIRSILDL